MKNTKIIIRTKDKIYPIYFGDEILRKTQNLIKQNLQNVQKIRILVDNNVPIKLLKKLKISLKKYDLKIYTLKVSEKIKSFKIANQLIEKLIKDNLSRSDCIIALGGGIIGDLSGFVSSLTKRGIKFINIPTTLLAQVDASIGGKTGVNSKQGKNLIGTFYQPDFVLIDFSFLKSLPKKQIICGYAEILKHSLVMDRKFFLWLNNKGDMIINKRDNKILKDAIIKSCKIKSTIVKKDEKEKNLRMILNYGHSFAHGFEAAKNFSKNLNHGQAVLLGMILAAKLAYQRKILSFNDFNLIEKHYLRLKLPMKIRKYFQKNQVDKIVSFMKKDKKNLDEKLNLILLKKIGKTTRPGSIKIDSRKMNIFLKRNY